LLRKISNIIRVHKGYSFATWTIVFTVVFVALAIIREPLKRGVAKKIKGTTDYVLWAQFGDEPQQEGRDENVMSKAKSASRSIQTVGDKEGIFSAELETPESKTSRVSAGVGEGAEAVLEMFEGAYDEVGLDEIQSKQ